tara:strand:- start:2765 stop:3040 length:276 start_codon:yes stop_codon:yes gene_type:complete
MQENSEPLVPMEDVAKHFAVSTSCLRSWFRRGQIPPHTYIKVGNTKRFRLKALEEALRGTTPLKPSALEGVDDTPREDPTNFDIDDLLEDI